MTSSSSAERAHLREVVRDFFERYDSPPTGRDHATAGAYDRNLWLRMAAELGLQGLAVPEQYGGSGGTLVELGVALEELGRALFGGPFLSTAVLAVDTLVKCSNPAVPAAFLPGIAGGELTACVATIDGDPIWPAPTVPVTTTARPAGRDRWLLTGEKTLVLDGATADLLVVSAVVAGRTSLFIVRAADGGVTRQLLTGLDLTRELAHVAFDDAIGLELVSAASADRQLRHLTSLAAVAATAEQVGGARACLDMAVAYAKTRVQFGRPIGSFQAVKHMIADMCSDVELAQSASRYGLSAMCERSPEADSIASMVNAFCSEAFYRVAAKNIQVHGAIGFTWEHRASHLYKRAKSSELLFGSPRTHRARAAQLMGL